MKRRTIVLLFLYLVTVLLSGCADAADAQELPEIRIGGSVYAPYFYREIDGSYSGIDVELAEEACRRMGYRPVFVELERYESEASLLGGGVDCLWSCQSMGGREEELLWAGPYLKTRRVIVVRDESEIYAPKDLEGKRVAVRSGSTSEDIILERKNNLLPELQRVTSVSTMGEVFAMLRSGYVDAAAGNESALRVYTDEYPDQYRYLKASLQSELLGVAFAPDGDAALAARLQETLEEMTADGTTARVLGAYGLDIGANIYGGDGDAGGSAQTEN